MVYGRDGEILVGGTIGGSGTTAADAAAFFITFQLIVLHAADAQFPHLLVFTDRCLRKFPFADKQDPERQPQEGDAEQNK